MSILRRATTALAAAALSLVLVSAQPPSSATLSQLPDVVAAQAVPAMPQTAGYALSVGGYCADGASCAQSSVDSHSLAYIAYPGWNFTEIAGHNYGAAGIIQKFRAGDTVKVSGHGAGTYRITRIVEVAKNSTVDKVPEGFAFQTCLSGTNKMVLAYATKVVPGSNPKGHVDTVKVNANRTITVSGWAFDADTPTSSTTVHIYVDGVGYSVPANKSRADVNKAYSALKTNAVGFTFTTSKKSPGAHSVKVAAINRGGGANVWVLSTSVRVR